VSELDIYRQALVVVVACFVSVGGALLVVVTWNARRVIDAMDGLKDTLQKEMRSFDRRLTRLETIARVRLEDFERDDSETRGKG